MSGIKISRLIGCGLLLIAIADLPYGYYQFLRIVISIIAGLNAFSELENENKILFFIFSLILVLFNPIIPIHLDKNTWTPINIIVGIIFGLSAFAYHDKKES
jgi:hypothetical protein